MSEQMKLFDAPAVVALEPSKLCPGCEEVKPLSYFYRRRRNPDGYGYMCANCENPRRRTNGPVIRVDQPESKQKKKDRTGYKRCMTRKSLRLKVFDRDHFCRLCGSSVNLEVHRILVRGKEATGSLDYLTCLCQKCHQAIHHGLVL